MRRLLLILLLCATSTFAQLTTNTARRVVSGPVLPVVCMVGDVYYLTLGAPGFYGCSPINTWVMASMGPAGGFTTGSVPFGLPTGALGQDNANFFWNDATNILTLSADPVNPPDAATKNYVDNAVGVKIDYFFNDTVSDIGGIYREMTDADLGGVESTLTVAGLGVGANQALYNFATIAAGAGLNNLHAGIYGIHFHAERTVGNRDVRIYTGIYTRTGGVDTLRTTSELSNLVTAKTSFDIHAVLAADVPILTTDRIVIKFFTNVVGGGANVTIVLYQEGTTDSHMTIPAVTSSLSAMFVRRDGTTTLTANWNAANTAQFTRLGLGVAAHATDLATITSIDTTASSKALNIAHSGAIVGTGYGAYVSKTGASTTNVGGYFSASGGTNNYGLLTVGNLGFNTILPVGAQQTKFTTTTPIIFATGDTLGSYTSVTFPTANKDYANKTSICTTCAVGDLVIITAGTGAYTGQYTVLAKISNDSIQLSRTCHNEAGDIADGAVSIVGSPRFSVGANRTYHMASLSNATSNETAFRYDYTVNKAAGNATGLQINATHTLAPGTNKPFQVNVGATERISTSDTGNTTLSYGHLKFVSEAVPGAPTSNAPTGGGGCTDGSHVIATTFVTANGETQYGAVSAAQTCVLGTLTQTIPVSAIPTGSSGVATGRNMCASKAGTVTPLYQVAASPTIPDNTTLLYDFVTADASLTVACNATDTSAGGIWMDGALRMQVSPTVNKVVITRIDVNSQAFVALMNGEKYLTYTNCADGTATPADCGSAAAGAVIISATATSVVVNTTAVTATSRIMVTEDSSLGAELTATCNTTLGRHYAVTAKTAATSFTITTDAAPVTNPACLTYLIFN